MPRGARTILGALNLPEADAYDLPASRKRFADGGQYRIEIPSCEGPRAIEAVIAAADEQRCRCTASARAAGSCCRQTTRSARMVALGRQRGIEVCLFVGPRANWDTGVQAASTSGRVLGLLSARRPISSPTGIEDVLPCGGARHSVRARRRHRAADDPRPDEGVWRSAGGLRLQGVGHAGGCQPGVPRGSSRISAPPRSTCPSICRFRRSPRFAQRSMRAIDF